MSGRAALFRGRTRSVGRIDLPTDRLMKKLLPTVSDSNGSRMTASGAFTGRIPLGPFVLVDPICNRSAPG